MAFGSNNMAKHWILGDSQRKLNLLELSTAGAFAGLSQSFVRCAVEQLKTVMQARNKAGSATLPPYRSTIHCLVDVVRTEGIRNGLYRALMPTLIREIPQYAIYYPSYELTKRALCEKGQRVADLGAAKMCLAGGIAGVAQWIPTFPIDVIKSRMHTAEPGQYKGMMDLSRQLFRSEGIGAFFRGFNASMVRAFPLHGAIFLFYELTMSALNTTTEDE
jgi:hypothetical protein